MMYAGSHLYRTNLPLRLKLLKLPGPHAQELTTPLQRLDYGNSCLLDFLPIFNDGYRPYNGVSRKPCTLTTWQFILNTAPQLAWYFHFVAMTTCLTPSRYCTGCVCQNVSTLNWRSSHTESWTVWRHSIWINSSGIMPARLSPSAIVVHAAAAHLAVPSVQPAVARFLSHCPFSGTLCQTTCSLHRLSLPSGVS